ncbi:coiled-coil domain-containing protein 105 [Tachyglossus aculeatus]|uniref:coiled-coil domain-containing protein 105 n=1 Tax=Tachyglossus aculeatus TaxID=9261 RepID=UPI0018F70EF7|nr:coiled-coil domain-containing protein 105 [Tachyglossus aculeatus]
MPRAKKPLDLESEDWVGAPKWREKILKTAQEAQSLTEMCGQRAVAMWHPKEPPRDPTVARRLIREAQLAPWRFRMQLVKGGGMMETPPRGKGVTLWWGKIKPPQWKSRMPLPLLRDMTTLQTSKQIHAYARECRLVAARLNRAGDQVNLKMRELMKQRQSTDHTLSIVRRGILVNQQCKQLRTYRPRSEKVPDQVDEILEKERQLLLKLKRKLEQDLGISESVVKDLAKCRSSLESCCQQRLLVVELLNKSLEEVLGEAGRKSWLFLSRPPSPWQEINPTPTANPLGAYTPECAVILDTAKNLYPKAHDVLKQLVKNQALVKTQQQEIYKQVRQKLTQKMKETMMLKERLNVSSGLMRGTINQSEKFKEDLEQTQGVLQGPMTVNYLETREKLTRPMVRVYQRHVGTQLPEATRLAQASQKLDKFLTHTNQDLEKLKATQEHLKSCMSSKQMGYDVDYAVLRLRQHQNHPHMTYEQAQRLVHN